MAGQPQSRARGAPQRPGRAAYAARWYRRPPDPQLHIELIGLRLERPAGGFPYRGLHRQWQLMVFHDPVTLACTGQAEMAVSAGAFVLWSPSRRPAWYGNRTRAWAHSWVVLGGTAWERLVAEHQLPLLQPMPEPHPSAAALCLHGLLHELTTRRQPDPVILADHLDILLRQLRRASADAVPEQSDRRLWWVRERLASDLGRPLDLGLLAREQGMSARHLVRRFTAAWGSTPQAYRSEARMAHAAELLRRPGTSIAAIAQAVGYSDAFAFSKAFSRWAGVPPTRYR